MSSLKTIYVFRHGETDWNKEHRMQGGSDIPLNENGRRQAAFLAEFFRANPVEVFLSSDLIRAHDTARIARGEMDVPIILDARLRETNLGDAEGMLFTEAEAKFGKDFILQWRHVGPEYQHVRFPNGESKLEHLMRLLNALESFMHAAPHQRIGVATHGGAIRRLIHHMRPELTEPVVIGNCVTYRMFYNIETRVWNADLEPVCVATQTAVGLKY